MATTYNRTISGDFGGDTPNTTKLHSEIIESAIVPALLAINVSGDDVDFIFASALSDPAEIAIMDAIIAAHDNTVIPDPITDYNRTIINSSSYTILEEDELIAVVYTIGEVTLSLPTISTLFGSKKKRYTIVDEGGNAGTNNIIVQTTGGDTINGSSIFTINGDYNSIQIYNNTTTGWFVAAI